MPRAGAEVKSNPDWLLPAIMRDVAAVIGRRQAFALSGAVCPRKTPDRRGVTRGRAGCVYVPRTLRDGRSERLIEILGRDDAQRMVDAFGGEILHFPPCYRFMQWHRDAAIRRMAAEGSPLWVVAWMFDMTERNVRNVVGSGRRSAESGRAGD